MRRRDYLKAFLLSCLAFYFANVSGGTPLAAVSAGEAMKPNRLWMEIAALGTATACALALLIATLGAATVAVTSRSEAGPVESVQIQSVPDEPVRLESMQSASVQSDSAQASDSPASRSVHEGMVTCSRCGAKHSADLGKTAKDCTRDCVHSGASFSLVDGDKTYKLDGDLLLLRKAAGQRARIAGQLRGNTITVTSIENAT